MGALTSRIRAWGHRTGKKTGRSNGVVGKRRGVEGRQRRCRRPCQNRRRWIGKYYGIRGLQSQREMRLQMGATREAARGPWVIFRSKFPRGSTDGSRRSIETGCTPTMEHNSVKALQRTRSGRHNGKLWRSFMHGDTMCQAGESGAALFTRCPRNS